MPKRYLVNLRQQLRNADGIEVDGKVRKFSKSGYGFILNDAGEAKELEAALGIKGTGQIVMSELPETRGTKSVKYITPNLTPKERREALIRDGWVEGRAGKWRKGLGDAR